MPMLAQSEPMSRNCCRMGEIVLGDLPDIKRIRCGEYCGVEHQYTSENEICGGRCDADWMSPSHPPHHCGKCGASF